MAEKRSTKLKKQLEQEILTGELLPGTRLDEQRLAERFDVSRTPVREALNQLSSMGLIETSPGCGATVRKVGLRELIEMFEVMAELESFCGSLAAMRMTIEEIKTMRQFHQDTQQLVSENRFDEYYEINVLFHECIYHGAHNKYLADQTIHLRNRLAPYRRLQLKHPSRLEISFTEHKEILSAIESRDSIKAAKLLTAHVTAQQGSFSDFVANLPADLINEET